MAKPIPQKAKAKKEMQEQVEIFKRATDARFELAQTAFQAQDEDTQAVILRIQKMLCVNANGAVRIYRNGNRREISRVVTVDMDYVEKNAFYMAIEILKDLAMMDVRVANFKFTEAFCAECGIKLNDRGKGKKKRRR